MNGTIGCTMCDSSKYQDENNRLNAKCESCPAGKERSSRIPCIDCREGSIQMVKSVLIARGMYADSSGARYKDCPEGHYQESEGGRTCRPCLQVMHPIQWVHPVSAVSLENIKVRKSSVYGCRICPGGKYADSEESSECKTAQLKILHDLKSHAHSKDNCEVCLVGTYNPYPGRGGCIKCLLAEQKGSRTAVTVGKEQYAATLKLSV